MLFKSSILRALTTLSRCESGSGLLAKAVTFLTTVFAFKGIVM